MLERCRATYLTQGLDSLSTVPDGSIDFVWSHATLEHIRADDFPATARELRRVMAPDGLASHEIDLADHLGDALNHLRLSRRISESKIMQTSGFYSNRMRYSEILDTFRAADFDCKVVRVSRWPEIPTPRSRLAPEFSYSSEDELRINAFEVVLKPA